MYDCVIYTMQLDMIDDRIEHDDPGWQSMQVDISSMIWSVRSTNQPRRSDHLICPSKNNRVVRSLHPLL